MYLYSNLRLAFEYKLNMSIETFENLMRPGWIFEFIKNASIFNFLQGGSYFLGIHIDDLKKKIRDLFKQVEDMNGIYQKFLEIEKDAFKLLKSLLRKEIYIFDGSLYIA